MKQRPWALSMRGLLKLMYLRQRPKEAGGDALGNGGGEGALLEQTVLFCFEGMPAKKEGAKKGRGGVEEKDGKRKRTPLQGGGGGF